MILSFSKMREAREWGAGLDAELRRSIAVRIRARIKKEFSFPSVPCPAKPEGKGKVNHE